MRQINLSTDILLNESSRLLNDRFQLVKQILPSEHANLLTQKT